MVCDSSFVINHGDGRGVDEAGVDESDENDDEEGDKDGDEEGRWRLKILTRATRTQHTETLRWRNSTRDGDLIALAYHICVTDGIPDHML